MSKKLVICAHTKCISRLASGSCAHSILHERIHFGDDRDCTTDPCQQNGLTYLCKQAETKWDE